MAAISSRVYAAPVGLDGELNMSQRVFGVIAAASASGRSLKPSASLVGTITGTPSASTTMSG